MLDYEGAGLKNQLTTRAGLAFELNIWEIRKDGTYLRENADLPFLKSQTGRIEPGGSGRTEIMGSPSRSGGFMSRGVSNHAQSDKAVYAGLRSRLHSHKL